MDHVPGRIPTVELLAWLDLNEIDDPWDREFMISARDTLDAQWHKRQIEKYAAKHKQASSKTKAK